MAFVSAVVLAYQDEPWLERCVDSLLKSSGVEVEVVLVDNGSTGDAVTRIGDRTGVKVVKPGRNLGFAGGCNLGATHASGEVFVFVNSDAFVHPGALAALARVAMRPSVGIASASLRLADDPSRLNSAGNPVHFLGLSWSGHYGEPGSAHAVERPAPFATGAAMAMRREVWEELGGFEDAYFAYQEDADISMRCWQLGLEVLFVPDSVIVHQYDFSRNPSKYYLLERNRLMFLLSLFETRTLVLLLPPLLFFEMGMFFLSLTQGWAREKVRGWIWLFRHYPWLMRRRAAVQERRRVCDSEIVPLLSSRFTAGNVSMPKALIPFDHLLAIYWRLILPLIGRPGVGKASFLSR
jgi:GT2 family glycosyltransferase